MKFYYWIVSALILGVSVTSCSHSPEIMLQTTEIRTGEISETVTATGTLESVTQVNVGTQVTGIVDKLYADYNSEVKKGELIAEIEKTLLDSELKSADANMESARLTYEYNKTNFERDKKLHEKQLISDYDFQTSQKDYEIARMAYDKAKADRVRAAKNLNYAEIYSPIDGVVISREVEVGQTVVSNMNVANLYVIADLDRMQVVGDVDEADIGRVKVGQEVVFSVDAYPDDKFRGTVSQVRLNPTTESNVVTYEVIVTTENPGHKLIPGLTANITIFVEHEEGVTIVENRALKFTPRDYPEVKGLPQPVEGGNMPEVSQSQKVLWKVEGQTLVPVAVTIGASDANSTQISGAVKDGDIVALDYETRRLDDKGPGESGEQSPFAPKPPSRNKKK